MAPMLDEPAQGYELAALSASAPLDPTSPEHIVQTARMEAERIREQAREEGRRNGIAEGLRAGESAVASAAQALAAARQELVAMAGRQGPALEGEAVQLAIALSERIIGGALSIEPQRVLDVLRGALRIVEERRSITIFVNPEDMPVVEPALDTLRASIGGIELCELQGDRRIERGGAILRTPEAEIDASLATQLTCAREVAEAELQRRSNGTEEGAEAVGAAP